jgi:hypothetical protein
VLQVTGEVELNGLLHDAILLHCEFSTMTQHNVPVPGVQTSISTVVPDAISVLQKMASVTLAESLAVGAFQHPPLVTALHKSPEHESVPAEATNPHEPTPEFVVRHCQWLEVHVTGLVLPAGL